MTTAAGQAMVEAAAACDVASTLVSAFEATTYRVDTDAGVFDLRIGRWDAAFAAFLARRRASRWAIVTACNPGAQPCSAARNRVLQNCLRVRLQADGWAPGRNMFPACNRADRDDWPDEPGWLLLEIQAAQARALAREFGQIACVYGEMGTTNSARGTGWPGAAAGMERTDGVADSLGHTGDAPRLLWV